jgi:hypothetical protein
MITLSDIILVADDLVFFVKTEAFQLSYLSENSFLFSHRTLIQREKAPPHVAFITVINILRALISCALKSW